MLYTEIKSHDASTDEEITEPHSESAAEDAVGEMNNMHLGYIVTILGQQAIIVVLLYCIARTLQTRKQGKS